MPAAYTASAEQSLAAAAQPDGADFSSLVVGPAWQDPCQHSTRLAMQQKPTITATGTLDVAQRSTHPACQGSKQHVCGVPDKQEMLSALLPVQQPHSSPVTFVPAAVASAPHSDCRQILSGTINNDWKLKVQLEI